MGQSTRANWGRQYTGYGAGIWFLIDLIMIATGKFTDREDLTIKPG